VRHVETEKIPIEIVTKVVYNGIEYKDFMSYNDEQMGEVFCEKLELAPKFVVAFERLRGKERQQQQT
jgi:hypothetical protein